MEHKSVLVVDDSSEMLALEKMILEGDGFVVFTAQSGAAALEILSKIENPYLILLDQQMGDMSGIEFMNLLDERNPEVIKNVPIVILSGEAPSQVGQSAGFIQKFPDIDVFLERVHHFMRKH